MGLMTSFSQFPKFLVNMFYVYLHYNFPSSFKASPLKIYEAFSNTRPQVGKIDFHFFVEFGREANFGYFKTTSSIRS